MKAPATRPDPTTMTSAQLLAEWNTWRAIRSGMIAIGQGRAVMPASTLARMTAIRIEYERRRNLQTDRESEGE